MFGPSSALERSKQRPPQTVVAFFVTCGFEDALAAPAAARPRDVATAADAATTQSPLVKRLRMVVPSCGCWAGHHLGGMGGLAWAGRGLQRCRLLLLVIPPCQPVCITLPWVVI